MRAARRSGGFLIAPSGGPNLGFMLFPRKPDLNPLALLRLAAPEKTHYAKGMTTVAEIETAIEKLPAAEYRELLEWIEERQAMIAASEAIFTMYDEEEAISLAQAAL